MPWEEEQEYIRSGHRSPDEFESRSLRTITLSEEEGIKAVIGKPKGKRTTEILSYLFEKDKWTLERAKKWFSEHEAKAKESFSWAGSIKEVPGVSNLIRGEALHPIQTVHPEEWPSVRVYLDEELEKSAQTLASKPLLLDHYKPLRGEVLGAEYKDGAIEYVAKLDDQEVLDQVRSGEIKHCSVEFEWKSLEQVNGLAPRGLNFTGLSLLKAFEPGDPLTSVEVWNQIAECLREARGKALQATENTRGREHAEPQEFVLYAVRDPAAFLEEHFFTAWVDLENGIQGIYGRLREGPETPQLTALLFMKSKGWTLEKMRDWLQNHPQYLRQPRPVSPVPAGVQPLPPTAQGVMEMSEQVLKERVWTRNYINNLPDSAFALILPGGTKEDGKTTPRSLRKFPHHRADGSIDLPHLRNANARVPQSDLTEDQKGEALAHLEKHKRAVGIGGATEESTVREQDEASEAPPEVSFEVSPEPTIDELIGSIEDAIEEINDTFDALVARVQALEEWQKESPRYKAQAQEQPLGEAIIAPSPSNQPHARDLISKKEVLALLPERIPRFWGYGPTRLVHDLKRRLQSQG